MVKRKVIGAMYSGFRNSTEAQKFLQQAGSMMKSAKKDTNKFINSVFTEGMKGTKNGVKAVATVLGLTGAANAAQSSNNNNNNSNKQKSLQRGVLEFLLKVNMQHLQNAKRTIENPNVLLDVLTAFIPIGAAGPIAKQGMQVLKAKGVQAAKKYIVNAAANARNNIVRKSAKYTQKAKEYKSILDGSINEAISKAKVFKAEGKPIEDIKFAKLIRENADRLQQLAKETGVKKASEIPNLLKFTRELGEIIRNSPNYIKSAAMSGKGRAGFIGNIGLSTYDLYQAFKENDNSLLPKSIANAGRIGGSLIKGNTIMKLLYGGLGYVAGDKLAKAALGKLGVRRETTPEQESEYATGMAYPDLESEIPEYLEGQSGRKYHVVGDKIYAFDTGQPVKVDEALADASNYYNTRRQKNEDVLAVVNQQIDDMQRAEQSGYQVPQEQKLALYNQRDSIQTELQQPTPRLNIMDDYDTSGDLVEQFRQREVVPVQEQQQAQQIQQQQNLSQVYEQLFSKIANDTYADLDNYYKPENQAYDYYQYMRQYARNQAPYMSPEEFSRHAKMQAMMQLAPTIKDKAMSYMTKLMELQQADRDYELKRASQLETGRHNYAQDLVSAYNAEEAARKNRANEYLNYLNYVETARKNRAGESIDMYNAYTGRQNANTSGMNAVTNRMEIPIKQGQLRLNQQEAQRKQQLLPYQQASYASETVMNAGMSGLPMEQFLNSNQSVMSQVFPGTQEQTKQNIQSINQNYGN